MTLTVQALAWTLIHFCWQAAAVAAVYRGLSGMIAARRSSNANYLLALCALLLMLAASMATFAYEFRSLSAGAGRSH